MGDARFNCVAILDAIPDGELNTARHLREDLRDIAAYVAEGLEVRYFRIKDRSDIEEALSVLEHEARTSGLIPWLHVEAHGTQDQEGFTTASGAYCPWSTLKTLVTPLNVATNIKVIIVLAACYGGSFTKAIRTIDRAPVLAVIGPTREVTSGQVKTDFPSFYKAFFETGSLKAAIEALTEHADRGLYFRTTAEKFFYDVWASYKATECSDEQIDMRARGIYRRLKQERVPNPPNIGRLKLLFRNAEQAIFEKYRDIYFMYDLFPDNRLRFPVSYKEAEDYAIRAQHH